MVATASAQTSCINSTVHLICQSKDRLGAGLGLHQVSLTIQITIPITRSLAEAWCGTEEKHGHIFPFQYRITLPFYARPIS
jgi:hypothetical protein